MAERFILKKSHRRGSLVRRVLWGMTALIVFPLFVHTVFLYFREYQSDINNVKTFLGVFLQAETNFLEGLVQEKKRSLERFDSSSSSDERHILGVQEIAPSSKKPRELFTRIDPETHLLWIGKNESDENAFGLSIDLTDWISRLSYLKQYQFPVSIDLRDPDGHLVSGKPARVTEKQVLVQGEVDDTGLKLELSVPLRSIQLYEIRYYAFSVFTLLILIGVVGGIAVVIFTRRLSKPFDELCKTMERVSEGSLHVRYRSDEMGYEINALGEQFNQTLDELLRRTQEAELEKIHRERLAQQLKIGHEIQRSMLPAALPAFSGVDLAPGYVAALEVSGDFYDLFQIDSDRLLCTVADCAGKGISACLYSLGFRSALRAFARVAKDLSEIVKKANNLLIMDTADSGFFITAWIGLYNAKTGVLQYCSQGHPPALLKRKSTLQELSTEGIPFGISPFEGEFVQQIQLVQDDFLLLYTDGILEAHNLEKKFFGFTRLKDFFLQFSGNSSRECVEQLLERVQQYSENTPQYDDMTLLAMKFFMRT
ncbi:MAG: SpoIIE family protein phosphatase [Chlamydiae bacterium]|nr:SpoIIE family protein phosphatase [Chlamydiota bacterium]